MTRSRLVRRLSTLVLSAACAITLAACKETASTGDKGYITGNGQIRVIDAADRGQPVELSGAGLDGAPLDVAALRGKPVVLNLWWSACAPCRAESPDLVSAHAELGAGASFIGINIRDNAPEMGLAFDREFGIDYPSIFDPDGTANLALAGYVRPGFIPSTVVLDSEGRVAAVVNGAIPSSRTLIDVVAEVDS